MKTLTRVIGAVVVCVILALGVLSITGNFDPHARTPGLWLKGDVTSFPADWTFADQYRTILGRPIPGIPSHTR